MELQTRLATTPLYKNISDPHGQKMRAYLLYQIIETSKSKW